MLSLIAAVSPVDYVLGVVAAVGSFGTLAAWRRAGAQNRADNATARASDARTDSTIVEAARGLVAELRLEMDRKVRDLDREVAKLQERLEQTIVQRNELHEENERLRADNERLRNAIHRLERKVHELQQQVEGTATSP